MPYCEPCDIEAEIKDLNLSKENAIVNEAQVIEFICQEDARIDACLSTRYDVPVTGKLSLKFLKRISIALVAWRVSDIISTRKASILPNGAITQDLSGAAAYKTALKDLNYLKYGDISLPDQKTKSSGVGDSFFDSGNLENCREPCFRMDEDQW